MPSGDPIPWSYIAQRIATVPITANSSTFTTTEIQIASISAYLKAGERYRITYWGNINSTAAGDTAAVRLREDDVSGTQFVSTSVYTPTSGGIGWSANVCGEYVAPANGNKTFVVSAVRTAGSGTMAAQAGTSRQGYLTLDLVVED